MSDSAIVGGDMHCSAGGYCQQVDSGFHVEQRIIDSFTALYTLYLRFTFSTNEMHATICVYDTAFLFSFWLSPTNLCCLSSWSKTTAGTVDHAQNDWAS